ncbi:hypothetical protein GCM10023194_45060 [Planotetraspora phitsanulokensis]|uniref:Uncharacterized protein n=1 Tax=Planotetraspora phitsanulokensis TaxID=575192 RepID=A0A8J3XE57_9ACTN|nr:hypothetical protein Pph01_31100 [Planotetraspora phitsanulokensis]
MWWRSARSLRGRWDARRRLLLWLRRKPYWRQPRVLGCIPTIVLSLLTGARTEELRALTWDHVDTKGDPNATPPIPPHVAVWRSVRAGGDTKTRKSRRTLALSKRCLDALQRQREQQEREREVAEAKVMGARRD